MTKIWKVSPGYNGEFWETFKQDGCIAIDNWGIKGLGDLIRYNSKDELKDAGVSASGAIQLWNFFREIKVGDIIIAYSEKCIWGIGKIISKYYFKNDSCYWQDENYIRDVEWKEIHPPLNVSSDERLFGDPPMRYGILNQQLTVIEIDGIDWGYMVNYYPVLRFKI